MSNSLIEKDGLLSQIDYTYLLKVLNRYMEQLKVEKSNRESIHITNLDLLIKQVVDEVAQNKSVYDILKVDKGKKIDVVSVNHTCKDKFRESIELLYRSLQENMGEVFRELKIDKLASYRIQEDFRSKDSFDLDYSFSRTMIPVGELTLSKSSNSLEAREIRVDKVITIIPAKEISIRIEQGLKSYLERNIYDDEELEDRIEDMYAGARGVSELKKALSSELIARINRSVSIEYMEYLLQDVPKGRARDLIVKYIGRIKNLESYLIKLSERADSEAIVTIEGQKYNILDMLSRGDAFEALPVVGIIDGNIGEINVGDTKCFEFGLRLKLNGRTSRSKSSYEHGIVCIDSEDEDYYKRLKYLCLYIFILFDLDKTANDISKRWERARDRINKDGKEGFKSVAKHLKNSLIKDRVESHLNTIRKSIIDASSKSSEKLKSKNIEKYITLHRGILSEDIEGNSFFKGMKNSKEYLSYVSIASRSREQESLFSIPINIKIQSKSLYLNLNEEIKQPIAMDYDISRIESMPVIFYSNHRKGQSKLSREELSKLKSQVGAFVNRVSGGKGRGAIYIVYNGSGESFIENEEKRYIYNLLYSIVSYMILNIIASVKFASEKKDNILEILRLHYKDEKETAEQIRGLSKILEHMINTDFRSSSQGVNLFEGFNRNKKMNALKSLYSRIPKRFNGLDANLLDKVAIVIISSRKSDRAWDSKNHTNTIYGEVIRLKKIEGNLVGCDRARTFGDNYREAELFTEPLELRDIMKDLYREGYKDVVYIAKTPYWSNLNITSETENLYFMDEDMLKYIRGDRDDQNIYPLYYDHIYSRDIGKSRIDPKAYIISGIEEMSSIETSQKRSSRGLFGLYSGLAVKGLYRSIIIYSVLQNSYRDRLLCRNTIELMEDSKVYKKVLYALKLYHCAVFEKAEKYSKLKINPYEKLMGFDGVGYHAIEEYITKSNRCLKTNKLSLMIDIRKIIDKENFNGGK